MNIYSTTLAVRTHGKLELINITDTVRDLLRESHIRSGFLNLFSLHTTAGLFISEFQEALLEDIRGFLNKVVDDGGWYKHNCPEFSDCDRHNAASHLRGLLLSQSLQLQVESGDVALGQFQSVIFTELDGPRDRALKVQVMGL